MSDVNIVRKQAGIYLFCVVFMASVQELNCHIV
jgi:hypothetical protein